MAEIAAIISAFIGPDVKAAPDLESRLRVAMKGARDFWMDAPDTERFRGAIAAAIVASSPDEKERIIKSAKALDAVSSALIASSKGASVDVLATIEAHGFDDVLPLRKWWDEAA